MSSATDAVFTLLEHAGLLGHAAEAALTARAGDCLQQGGWRAQVTVNEARRLQSGPECFDRGDVFALPEGT